MKTQLIGGFIAFGIIFAIPIFAQPKDVQGWREARWGMTEDEILKTFKGEAVRLDKIEEYNSKLNQYASIGIINYDIEGAKYKVSFILDKTTKALIKVSISQFNAGGGSGLYKNNFRKLSQLLTEKYGAPSFKDDSNKILNESKIVWNFPSTIIELSYADMRD